MDWNEQQVGLIYNNVENLSNLFQEIFDETIELTDETNFDDLMHYFRDDIGTKKFCNCKNEMKLFEKTKSGDMKLEKEKITCKMCLN